MPESTSAFHNVTADPSNGDSPTPGSSSQSTSDPALSLRAVALSTLKSKRRKPASTQSQFTLPRPALAESSVQLDYGQDDKDPPSPEAMPSANSKSAPENDDQPREEGEISDSEEAQLALAASGQPVPANSPPSPSKLSQPSPSLDSKSGYAPTLTSPTSVSFKQDTTPPPSNLLDRISGPETVPPSSIAHQREGSVSTITADDMDIDQSSHFVDENHVRPGLSMNQAQYDTAKDIILDLLGWGVPPSYLLDCGLSREIIFYVFSELNLRLPDGINPNEFVPYNPTTVAMLVRGVNVPPGGFPNLPSKPMPSIRNGHFATPQMSPMLDSPDSSSLNDMEKQRRQELLARKAVYASRKGKMPRKDTSSMMPSPSHGQDVEMTSVPTATVDDFLKTIESSDEAPQTHQRDERMVVDPSESRRENHIQSSQHPSRTVCSPIEPPNSAESHTTDFGPPSRRSSSSTSSNDTQRRPGKRPVAADFVDFESGPHHRNGHPHPHLKRKQEGSFASVSTTRRCVIDLSDDEDGTKDEIGYVGTQGFEHNSPVLGAPTKIETTGYSTPLLASTTTSTPRTMSPGVGTLAEKEKEILKMRQMIAERERSRVVKSLKFKKMNSSTNGEDNQEGAHTPALSVPVKQEEEEMPFHSPKFDVHTMVIDTTTTTTLTTQNDQAADGDPPQDSEASSTASTPPPIDCPQDTPSIPQTDTPNQAEDPDLEAQGDHLVSQSQAKESVDVDPNSSSSAQATPTISQLHPRPGENQVPSQKKHEEDEYQRYNSLFSGYPLLRSRPTDNKSTVIPTPDKNDSTSSASHSSTSSNPNASDFSSNAPFDPHASTSFLPYSNTFSSLTFSAIHPDLKPLRIAAVMKVLDPDRPICQYEIPGGGVCRDPGCEDNHLSRIGSGAAGPSQNLFSQRYQPSVVEPNDQDTAQYLADSWGSSDDDSLKQRIIAALEDVRSKNPSMVFEERVSLAITLVQSTPSTLAV